MADSYPTVGLGVDLSAIDKGIAGYARLEQAIDKVGVSGDKMAKAVGASLRDAATLVRSTTTEAEQGAGRRVTAYQQELRAQKAAANEAKRAAEERIRALRVLEQAVRTASSSAVGHSKAEAASIQVAIARLKELAQAEVTRAAAGKAAADAQIRATRQATQEDERSARQRLSSIKLVKEANATASAAVMAELKAEAAQLQVNILRHREAAAAAAAARAQSRGTGGGSGGPTSNDITLLGRFTGGLGVLRDGLRELRRVTFDVRTAFAVLLGGMVVKPIADAADAMTALRARAAAFTDSASDVPYLMARIYQTAQDSRAPLEAVATLYTRLAPLAKQLGKSQEDMLKVTSTVLKGAAIGGSTPEEMKSTSQQLAQALASNRLGGDELRSLAENAPILMGQIAKALDMNTGQFIKWAHAGKANAAVVIEALEKAAPEIDAMFAKFPTTISQSVTLVSNALKQLVGRVDEMTGTSRVVAEFIAGFAGFFDRQETIEGAAKALMAVGKALEFIGSVGKGVMDFMPAFAAILAVIALRAGLAAIANSALAKSIQATAAAAGLAGPAAMGLAVANTAIGVAAGGTATALRGLVAFMGGPLGVALIAAAALWAIYAKQQNAAKAAADELASNQGNAQAAMARASMFLQAYNGDVNKMATLQAQAAGVTVTHTDKTNEATAAAYARAEAEKALTLSILMKNAAESQAAGVKDLASAGLAGTQAAGYEASARVFKSVGLSSPWDDKNASAARARQANLLRTSTLNSNVATALYRSAELVAQTPAIPTIPNGSGVADTSTTDKKAGRGDGLEGARDKVHALALELENLKSLFKDMSTNPLSTWLDEIAKSGDAAAASIEGGNKANADLAKQARDTAEAVKMQELLNTAKREALKNTEENNIASAAAASNATAELNAASIMREFWGTGSTDAKAYGEAVAASMRAVTDAAVSESNLSIARRYGAESLDTISQTLQTVVGVDKEYADSIQATAQKEAESTKNRLEAADSFRHQAEEQARAIQMVEAANQRAMDALDRMDSQAQRLGDTLEGAFGRGGRALGGMLDAMTSYAKVAEVARANNARAAVEFGAQSNEAKRIAREGSEDMRDARVDAYGEMISASKEFFKQNSTGYKLLEGAEKAYRMFEFAMSAKAVVVKTVEVAAKSGLFATEAAGAAAAGAAQMFAALGPLGFPAVAAMAAVLAGFGIKALGGGGGGGAPAVTSADRQTAQGSGSVFGDSTAKSASISKALEITQSYQNKDLEYGNAMLSSLRSIDSKIGVLAAGVVQSLTASGSFSTAGLGLGTTNVGGSLLGTAGAAGGGALAGLGLGGLAGGALAGAGAGGLLSGSILGIGVSSGFAGGLMTAGSLLGPIGALVGAVVAPLLFSAKQSVSVADQGLAFNSQSVGDIAGSGISGNAYTDLATQTKKKFIGLTYSNKTKNSTVTSALDDEVNRQLSDIVVSLRDGVLEAGRALGIDGAQATLDAFTVQIGSISFKDMTGGEISEALNAVFSKLGDDLASTLMPSIDGLRKVGEGAFETLVRLAREYQVVDFTLQSIGKTFGEVGVSSIAARDALVEMSGGLEQFTSQAKFFSENFLTEAERLAPIQANVTAALSDMGYSSVTTREQFKNAVLALDLTTEAGRKNYAALMALAPAFDKVATAAEDAAAVADQAAKDAARQALTDAQQAVTDAESALARARQAEAKTLQDTAKDLEGVISRMKGFSATIRDFRRGLSTGDLSGNDSLGNYRDARQDFLSTSALAQLGNEDALGRLTGVSQTFLQASLDTADDQLFYLRDLALVKNALDTAADVADRQVDIAQSQLDALNTQIELLTAVNDNVLTVAQALQNLNAAKANLAALTGGASAGAGGAGGSSGRGTANLMATGVMPTKDEIDKVIAAFGFTAGGPTGMDPQASAAAMITGFRDGNIALDSSSGRVLAGLFGGADSSPNDAAMSSGYNSNNTNKSPEYLAAQQAVWDAINFGDGASYNAAMQAFEKVQGYALGGDHSGGVRLVGELGPEIEATGAARYFNARQTADILGGGGAANDDVATLLLKLIQLLQSMGVDVGEIAKDVNKMEEIAISVTDNGEGVILATGTDG